MKKAVVFLGSAGAGKSTLINLLSGKNDAIVSNRICVDGTAEVHNIKDDSDESLIYVDTPGLDSSNFSVSARERVQVLHAQNSILVVLVISKKAPRVTSYIKTFENTLKALVGNHSFVIYWSNEGIVKTEDENDMKKNFQLLRCVRT